MGLLSAIAPGNPISGWLDPNRSKVTGFFGGMVGGGNDPRGTLQGAIAGLQGGVAPDNAYVQQQQLQAEKAAAVAEEQDKQNATIKWLADNGRADLVAAIQGGLPVAEAWQQALTQPKTEAKPAAIQEYEYAVDQGFKGTFAEYETQMKRAGATNLTFNGDQANAAGFADRMKAAETVLQQTEQIQTDWGEAAKSSAPFGAGNFLISPEYQLALQAQRDFVNAVLRKESGAAISETEFENARKQYFPQPGDSPQVIQRKRENRAIAIASMQRSGGPAYNNPAAAGSNVTLPPSAGGFTVLSVE